MVIMHKNKLEESQFLEMYVTPCPSVWYQNVIFGVLAHGLSWQIFLGIMKRGRSPHGKFFWE